MVPAGRVEQVAGQARVEAEPAQLHAGPPPGDQVSLQVMADLDQRLVLEQRLEQGLRFRGGQLGWSEELVARAMSQRHVDGFVGERDGHPEQLVAQRLVLAGQGENGKSPRRARLLDQLLDGREIRSENSRAAGRRRRRLGQVVDEPHELQLGEELAGARLVDRPHDEIFELDRQRQVLVERDQLPAQPHLVDRGEQVLAQLGLLHRRRVLQHALERAELLEQRSRGLLADPGHSGDVVDLVPRQRQQIPHLHRRHAPFLFHLGGAVPLLVHGVVALDALAHQLHQILVAGDDDHFPALLARPPRQRGDDVVGLVAGKTHRGDAQRLQHLADEGKLRSQVLRRRAARRLVLGVDLAALGLGLLVEGDGEVRGISLADGLEQHGGEAVDGVGGHALAGGEMGQGVIGAEDGVRPIDQPERRHRRVVTSPPLSGSV